jgi:hypothetical protein
MPLEFRELLSGLRIVFFVAAFARPAKSSEPYVRSGIATFSFVRVIGSDFRSSVQAPFFALPGMIRMVPPLLAGNGAPDTGCRLAGDGSSTPFFGVEGSSLGKDEASID